MRKKYIDKDYLGDVYYNKALYVRRYGNPLRKTALWS